MTTDAQAPALATRAARRISPLTVVGVALLGLVVVWLGVNAYQTPYTFLNLFLAGLTLGAVYGLVALGYTLVYGILELINFAHGDVFMLGAMMTVTAVGWFGLAPLGTSSSKVLLFVVPMLLIAVVFCGVLNATIEFIAYKPLRGAPRLAPLITAIGVSFILQNAGLVWKGSAPVNIRDNILPRGHIFDVGKVGDSASYSWNKLIVLIVTAPTLLLLVWLVQHTKQGKAMRATAQDKEAAAVMGINVNRTISFTFLIAGGLAGAAGLLYALFITSVTYDTGFKLGLYAFTAAVLGGIGNLPGAVLGALFIGFVQFFNEGLSWHTPGSDWTNALIFSILILILVFRPEGILGERTPEGG